VKNAISPKKIIYLRRRVVGNSLPVIDYAPLAFYLHRWRELGIEPQLMDSRFVAHGDRGSQRCSGDSPIASRAAAKARPSATCPPAS